MDEISKKKLKVGSGFLGGSGLLVLAFNLMGDKIDNIEKIATSQRVEVLSIVDFKYESLNSKLSSILDQQKETNLKIDRLDQRVYELKQKSISAIFKDENNTN